MRRLARSTTCFLSTSPGSGEAKGRSICHRRRADRQPSVVAHRGVSLVIVMIAISMSMAITYAALSTQSRGLQVRQNVNRQELAHQAAESGAAIALNNLQSSAWGGVSTSLSGSLTSDLQGSTSYTVSFLTVDGETSPSVYATGAGQSSLSSSSAFFNPTSTGLSTSSADAAATATRQAFQLMIQSTGKWQSATDPLDSVTETVEVGVELQPRVPGRTILSPDILSATDVLASNASYDTIQTYALFASSGSSSNSSLTLEPGQRIDGTSWLMQGVPVFKSPNWQNSTRTNFLESTASVLSSTSSGVTTLYHPHPFGGTITMRNGFSTSETTDLTKLNVPRTTTSTTPSTPTITFSNWQTYKLYQGGFSYSAETLSSGTLSGAVLRPSLRNPLGVFYRDGSLTVGDNVVIQGTLVCSGTVTLSGANIEIDSVNWRDSAGANLIADASLFRRMPALVAQNVIVSLNTSTSIDGAMLLTGTISGGAGSYDYVSGSSVDISGTQATSTPIRQPYSQVQLPSGTSLTNVSAGTHAIWLAEGNSGNWYSIVEVDIANRRLIVLGEATRSSSTSFRIIRRRVRQFDLRGPLMTGRATFSVSTPWVLNPGQWNSQESAWTNAGSTPAFVTWVANPANYVGAGSPWETAGLPLEPVVHIRPQTGITFRDSLPLFSSYVAPSTLITATNDPSGYRWRTVFWRDMP